MTNVDAEDAEDRERRKVGLLEAEENELGRLKDGSSLKLAA